jgi:chromosome segregation ATPase
MRSTPAALLGCALLMVLRAAPARADAATESRLREALRTATTQLRALEDERASWQAGEAALRKQIESLRNELGAARASASRAGGRGVEDAKRRLAEQVEASARLGESLARCEATARDTADAARTQQDRQARLEAEARSLSERLGAAESRNARMYRLAKEVIDRFANMGAGASLAACEPIFGLKRVALENLAQDYDDKLLEQKVKP